MRSSAITGPSVSNVAKAVMRGWASRKFPAKSRTPPTLAVKVAFGGNGTCGTNVSTRLFTPRETVPGTGPAGPVRVTTAPGCTGSSKESLTVLVTSTCSDPVTGVKLSRAGGR